MKRIKKQNETKLEMSDYELFKMVCMTVDAHEQTMAELDKEKHTIGGMTLLATTIQGLYEAMHVRLISDSHEYTRSQLLILDKFMDDVKNVYMPRINAISDVLFSTEQPEV